MGASPECGLIGIVSDFFGSVIFSNLMQKLLIGTWKSVYAMVCTRYKYSYCCPLKLIQDHALTDFLYADVHVRAEAVTRRMP